MSVEENLRLMKTLDDALEFGARQSRVGNVQEMPC